MADEPFICPECGRTFTRAQALGIHRRRAHGVHGAPRKTAAAKTKARTRKAAAKRTATPRKRKSATRGRATARTAASNGTRNGALNKNLLLQTVFPRGQPTDLALIARAVAWVDEAEALAQG